MSKPFQIFVSQKGAISLKSWHLNVHYMSEYFDITLVSLQMDLRISTTAENIGIKHFLK